MIPMTIPDRISNIFLPYLSTITTANAVPKIWNRATKKADKPNKKEPFQRLIVLDVVRCNTKKMIIHSKKTCKKEAEI